MLIACKPRAGLCLMFVLLSTSVGLVGCGPVGLSGTSPTVAYA